MNIAANQTSRDSPMQTNNKIMQAHPVLPEALALPLKMMPAVIHNKALVATLNKIFHNDLKQGELDFLQGHIIQISLIDADIEFRFTIHNDKLIAANKNQAADLFLKGTVYDYLLLASRQEDTDTLFFNRRLHMQGDTELGLYVKNFLDGMDMDSHKVPAYLEAVIKKSLPVYERLFSKEKQPPL